LALMAAVAVAAAYALVIMLWWSPGPKPGVHRLLVKEGATVATVARQLDSAGAIPGNALTFRVFSRLLGSNDPIQAGEFEIPRWTSAARILDLLQHGKPVQRLITVPEGMPSILVQEKVAAIHYLSGPVPEITEGSVLPDTYGYQRGESRAAVIARMQKAMARTLARAWTKRTGDCPLGSPEEAVTLASIVEKETGKPSERPMIAGVYCNRLRQGMALVADPTVIYPITGGKPLGRRILKSELKSDNPYNTYAHAGRPPGPITNPGRASIEAVLKPAKTQALYFVADGTGGHVFARTLAEQIANVAKWYKLRRSRGEM
jgi:UPF0755 protein